MRKLINQILIELFNGYHFHEWRSLYSQNKRRCYICKKTQQRYSWDLKKWYDIPEKIAKTIADPIHWEDQND